MYLFYIIRYVCKLNTFGLLTVLQYLLLASLAGARLKRILLISVEIKRSQEKEKKSCDFLLSSGVDVEPFRLETNQTQQHLFLK